MNARAEALLDEFHSYTYDDEGNEKVIYRSQTMDDEYDHNDDTDIPQMPGHGGGSSGRGRSARRSTGDDTTPRRSRSRSIDRFLPGFLRRGYGYDEEFDPASRYDPTTMSRAVDLTDLVDELVVDGTGEFDDVDEGAASRDHLMYNVVGTEQCVERPHRVRRALCVAFTLCIVILASVGIGITAKANTSVEEEEVGTTTGGGGGGFDDEEATVGDSGPSTTTTVYNPPPFLPSTFATYCTHEAVSTNEGYKVCEELCEPAECCQDSTEDGCRTTGHNGNEELCDKYYDACSVLHQHAVWSTTSSSSSTSSDLLGKAEQVVTACSDESLAKPSGRSDCQRLCHGKMCCFEDEDDGLNCASDPDKDCFAFAGCKALFSADDVDVGAFTEDGFHTPTTLTTLDHAALVKACSWDSLETFEGIQQCNTLCASRLCCYAYNDDENCWTDAFDEECRTYLPCQALFDGPTKSSSSSATEEAIGYTSSHDVYEPADHYIPAPGGGADVYDPADHIPDTEACSSDTIETTYRACHDLCAGHMCCFVPDGLHPSGCKSAREGKGDTSCTDVYAPCAILTMYGAEDTTEVTIDVMGGDEMEVEDACDSAEIANDAQKLAQCESLCSDRACCFASGAGNCYRMNPDWCDDYEACGVLEGRDNLGGSYYGFSDPVTLDSLDHQILMEACSAASINTLDGLNHCHDLCESRLCCFSELEGENCWVDHQEECSTYEPCQLLVEPTGNVGGGSDGGGGLSTLDATFDLEAAVEEVCTPEAVSSSAEGLAICHALCANHLCCFAPGGTKSNCVDAAGSDVCARHEACKVLLDDGGDANGGGGSEIEGGVTGAQAVNQVCHVDADYAQMSDCESLCAERNCCFQEGPGNCYPMNPDWCDEYEACAILGSKNMGGDYYNEVVNDNSIVGGGSGSGTDDNAIQNEALNLCLPEKLETANGLAECEAICSMYLCCSDVNDSCYDQNEVLCEEFVGCDQLYSYKHDLVGSETGSGTTSDVLIKDEISNLCLPEKLETPDGFATCEAMCGAYLCCFDVNDSCYDHNEAVCKEFVGCEQLYSYKNILLVGAGNGMVADEVSSLCLPEKLQTSDGLAGCEAMCNSYLCCFDVNDSCYDQNEEVCKEFAGCEQLHAYKSAEQSSGQPMQPLGSEASAVVAACKEQALEEDPSQCEQLCEDAACCYDDEPEENCSQVLKAFCASYAPCGIVFA